MMSQLSFTVFFTSIILYLTSGAQQATAAGPPCSSSFHLLEADLLSHPQNRFFLTTKFFPPRDANPVIIKVDYVYEDSNITNVWFWSESEFYLIQPLEIFLYTSLFFANQPYRQSTVTLELSTHCLNAEELHMKVLTQRVSQSKTIAVHQLLHGKSSMNSNLCSTHIATTSNSLKSLRGIHKVKDKAGCGRCPYIEETFDILLRYSITGLLICHMSEYT